MHCEGKLREIPDASGSSSKVIWTGHEQTAATHMCCSSLEIKMFDEPVAVENHGKVDEKEKKGESTTFDSVKVEVLSVFDDSRILTSI